jgi:hypothetical protein
MGRRRHPRSLGHGLRTARDESEQDGLPDPVSLIPPSRGRWLIRQLTAPQGRRASDDAELAVPAARGPRLAR